MISSLVFGLTACALTTPSARGGELCPWTLLVYAAADNNADGPVLAFLDSVRAALDDDPGMDVVLLIDRSKEFSNDARSLGQDFDGTRLYRLHAKSAERLAGGSQMPEIALDRDVELDTADANVLGRFIAFGKAHAPATRYALMIYSHANGIVMCPDDESQSRMGITDLTRVLDSSSSVDFLALELCNMAGIEVAYQWRPGTERFGAEVLVAIPNAGPPLDWDRAFARIRTPGHASSAAQPFLEPSKMSAADFGRLVIDEGRRGRELANADDVRHESASCFDLRASNGVKTAVDALARVAANESGKRAFVAARGDAADHALNYARGGPHVDLFDLCRRARSKLDERGQKACDDVMTAVDTFVLASFGMPGYAGFEPGKNGIYVLMPAGDEIEDGVRHWSHFGWYTPLERLSKDKGAGGWAFLGDGAKPANGVAETWFELLDSWFDPDPEQNGGVNSYRW